MLFINVSLPLFMRHCLTHLLLHMSFFTIHSKCLRVSNLYGLICKSRPWLCTKHAIHIHVNIWIYHLILNVGGRWAKSNYILYVLYIYHGFIEKIHFLTRFFYTAFWIPYGLCESVTKHNIHSLYKLNFEVLIFKRQKLTFWTKSYI